jgi:signal transduction histidine kinase
VFHEVNNPLSIIKNYLKILGVKLSDIKVAQDEIRIINEEIDRIALILSDISPITEDPVSGNEQVDANLLITDLVKIMEQTLLKNSMITLHLNLDPMIPHILAEKNRFKQVLINLIKNAIDAVSKGGNIYLQTRRPPAYGPEQTGYVEISVADDGMGIPDHIKQKLFEPFVSAKGSGHSGLGLSIVHNIIASFNGKITCESHKDKGTRFIIELPAAENQKF